MPLSSSATAGQRERTFAMYERMTPRFHDCPPGKRRASGHPGGPKGAWHGSLFWAIPFCHSPLSRGYDLSQANPLGVQDPTRHCQAKKEVWYQLWCALVDKCALAYHIVVRCDGGRNGREARWEKKRKGNLQGYKAKNSLGVSLREWKRWSHVSGRAKVLASSSVAGRGGSFTKMEGV